MIFPCGQLAVYTRHVMSGNSDRSQIDDQRSKKLIHAVKITHIYKKKCADSNSTATKVQNVCLALDTTD